MTSEDPWDKFGDSLDKQFKLINQQFEMLEQRLERHEEMMAKMLTQQTQLWSGLEAIISVVLDEKPPEVREKFEAEIQWYANELWKAMKTSADVARSAEEAPGTMADPDGGEYPLSSNP